jgi:hypothetical protein
MRRSTRSVVLALICALVVVGLSGGPADAKAKKGKKKLVKVSMIVRAGQDWDRGRLKVRWKAQKGVAYHMRYAGSPAALASTRPVWVGNARGAYTRPLDRSKTWFFQVRAVRSAGVVGPWSNVRPLRFLNRWPGKPQVSGTSIAGGVQFNWTKAAYTTRYRVRWSPAWYGVWPGPVNYTTDGGAWMGGTARSTTFKVPTKAEPGDGMLAVAYGNPVFGRVESNNSYARSSQPATSLSTWTLAWPKAPAPEAGDPIRFATYNVMLSPTGSRASAVAKNISSHGVTVAALQEANSKTSSAVLAALGSNWKAAPLVSGVQQLILYRSDLFNLEASGSFGVSNYKTPSSPIKTPWARLKHKTSVGSSSQAFYVASLHFNYNASRTPKERQADSAKNAKETLDAFRGINTTNAPIILAGDLQYNREPWGDSPGYVPAQPTFVRNGFYDAMAAQSKSGTAYSTFNGKPNGGKQAPHGSGLGPRPDHILMKGIVGAKTYVNVLNWSTGGVVPSDHNLVYSDIMVPTP